MNELWSEFSEEDWASVTAVNDRVATESDVKAGAAGFYINEGSAPYSLDLPCQAYQVLDDDTEVKVVIIQAEEIPDGIIVGVRYLNGGNGLCNLSEVRLCPLGW
jgi:hypothetical protein